MLFAILLTLAGLSALYVVYTLIVGASQMAKTGDGAREKSNAWMWKRVTGQAVALLLFIAAFYVKRSGG